MTPEHERLRKRVDEVTRATREECAKICEDLADEILRGHQDIGIRIAMENVARELASRISARNAKMR